MLFNRIIIILHDLFMIPLAWFVAYWLRFETIPTYFLHRAVIILPFLVLVQAFVYQIFGLYRGIWRFASLPDLIRIIKSVLFGSTIMVLGLWLFTHMYDLPRSIFPIYALLLIGLLGGSRLAVRSFKDIKTLMKTQQRALIVGAGFTADALLRDLHRTRRYIPIVLVDDDPKRQGYELRGIRVKGFCKDIPELVKKYRIDFIIIAIPSASSEALREIVRHCEKTNISFQILPQFIDINSLRPVDIEDLLGRMPVSLDQPAIHSGLSKKTILVTGGGGSIGSEICRQLATVNLDKLIVIENNEFNLYSLEKNLAIKIYGHLADVTDKIAVNHLIRLYKPDIIFHAAAYKHVPLLETHARMAVRNNVLGTHIMAKAAIENQVKTFVLISTDKAVNPTNILGATKRLAEMICQQFESNTQFVTVRFGNVLGSAGSVVPLFKQQLQAGGPITVTHPDIKRFFMTIPEATQLILQATIMAKGGEIFVLDMGEPIRIQYLAEQLIRLSGRIPGKDVAIQYIGLRPGEKLHEELFYANEKLIPTSHVKILLAQSKQHLNIMEKLEKLEKACENYEEQDLRDILVQLVPEYKQSIKNKVQS